MDFYPYTPLGGLEKDLCHLVSRRGGKRSKDASQSMIKEILGKGREITIKNGVNGVHAMLDALKSKEG